MRYAAPWDWTIRITTAVVTGLLVLLGGGVSIAGWLAGGSEFAAIGAFIALAFGTALLLVRALAPTGFAIGAGQVRIERRLRPLAIPLARIRAAGPVPDRSLARALRLGGSGGLFGWYGRHWTRALGEFRIYATRMRGLVQLDTPEGRWVLSPEPPDRFLAELLASAPGAVLAPPEGPHERHPLPRGTVIRFAALVALAPVVAAAVVVASSAWAPVGARVEGGAVQIERRWVAPLEIPLSTVRGVEVPTRERIGQVRKVTGYRGWGGVQYGRFRGSVLGEFRLYAWHRGRWVLLDTDDGPVILTPDDPERFVAQVRAGMGRGAVTPRGRPRRRRRPRGAPPCRARRASGLAPRRGRGRPCGAPRSTGSPTAG